MQAFALSGSESEIPMPAQWTWERFTVVDMGSALQVSPGFLLRGLQGSQRGSIGRYPLSEVFVVVHSGFNWALLWGSCKAY